MPNEQSPATQHTPNILLVIADDLGMADLGSFGGEIATPNLDRLAYRGVRFTQFRASPSCSPSRAMLFTGVDSHKAGIGNMAEEMAPNQKGKPGYEGRLNNRVVTIATRLQDAGYKTYLTGKWHLGLDEANSPYQRGFDRTFAMLTGGAHHFDDPKPAYAPSPEIKAPFRENGRTITTLPDNYHYSSQFFVDRLIDYIDTDRVAIEQGTGGKQQPFFAVLSYMAPHWPLQAPAEAVERYKGKYRSGYEDIAKERLARQKHLKIVQADHPTVPLYHEIKPWSDLDATEQKTQAKAMEIYAAMITELDRHTGRLFAYLRKENLFDNTVIIFLSDNGAEGHDLDRTWPADKFPDIRGVVDSQHDFSYERMGQKDSYVLYGAGWARAGAPGFRLHKAFVTEGGIRVPMFMYHPQTFPAGTIHRGQFHIKDVAPTILSIAGIKPLATIRYNGKKVEPITGMDMLPYVRIGASNPMPAKRVEVFEVIGKRYVLDYPWKLLHHPVPYGKGHWALYNLEDDPTEVHDLSTDLPQKVVALERHWEAYARQNNVILPNWLSGY